MKTFNNFFILCFTILFTINISAQNKDRVGPALNGFMQTDFMLKFQDMKGQAETMVKSFQSQSFQYPPSDVARVQVSYDKTARRFNQVLEMIKNDFLDNNKLKLISSNPEYYAKGLELEMYQLSDYYAQNFQQVLADVTGNQIDGNPIVLLLVQMISGISGTMNHFSRIKKEARMYDQAYLNRHLVTPHRFKTWDEITGGASGGGFQQNNPYGGQNNGGYPTNNDPYGGQNNGNFPTNNDPYGGQNNGNFPTNNDPYGGQNNGNFPTNNDPYGGQNNGGFPNNNDPYSGQNNGGFPNNNDPYGGQNNGNFPTNNDPYGNQNYNQTQNSPTNQNYNQNFQQNNQNGNTDPNWNWNLPTNQNQQMNFDGGSNSVKTDSTKVKKKAQAPRN